MYTDKYSHKQKKDKGEKKPARPAASAPRAAASATRPAASAPRAAAHHDAAPAVRGGRATLADEAYRRIRDMILNLELFPGQTILLEDLAERLQMSRTPVRQAIERLSTGMEGLVQTVPRKGIMVTFPDAEDMREIYEIMQGLEGQAVRLAIRRLDAASLAGFAQALRRQEEALGRDDRQGWAVADREFHAHLIGTAGNKRLQDLVGMFRDQLNRTRVATLNLRPLESLRQSTNEHRKLVEALGARDIERALRVHSRHRERTINELPRIMKDAMRMVVQAGMGGSLS